MLVLASSGDFASVIETVGKAVDGTGVAVVVAGILWATIKGVRRPAASGDEDGYRRYRQDIGRAILLGLEFLVAGDIIRTVAVSPSFTSVGVLAVIVVVRTFLSFTLELELVGRWPWQRAPAGASAPEPPR